MRSLAAAALVLLAGCNLYFGGDDEPPICDYAYLSPAELRNPQTGLCEASGSYPCDGVCGPCPAGEPAQKDWGSCYSACEGLTENTCIATAGCRAAYENNPQTDEGPRFWGCWAVAPSGPVQGGDCTVLGAQDCSRHDDCSAYYDNYLALDPAPVPAFNRCTAEKAVGATCYADEDCGSGERCTAGEEDCLSGCDPSDPGTSCPAVCQGYCVPTLTCANADCGPGTHCEEQCKNGSCGPVCVPDASGCTAIDCGPGYDCVEVCSDGGPSGPDVCKSECVPADACETLQTEGACTSRTDCVPVYQGEDCTCYPGSCECNILTYERCETA